MANEVAAELGEAQVRARGCCVESLSCALSCAVQQRGQPEQIAWPGGEYCERGLAVAPCAPPPSPLLTPNCALPSRPAPPRPAPQRGRMRALFRQGCRMEYLFWDGAWARQQWPV